MKRDALSMPLDRGSQTSNREFSEFRARAVRRIEI